MSRSDLVDVAVELRRETDLAWLVFDGTKLVWVPKSQCELEGGVLTLPEWMALKRGLI